MVVAELFLSAFLQVLFDRFAPRARDLWNLARREGLEKKLEKLETTFRTIQAVLADAEEKQLTERDVKLWLDDLRDLAYDAEDVLDEFATEALRQKVVERQAGATSSKLLNLVPSPTAIKFRVKMKSKIKAITSRLQEVSERRHQLGLVEINVGGMPRSTSTWQPTPTTSSPKETVVYGRDEDKERIIDLLLNTNETAHFNFRVLPIVGMGGLGKTTLARHVYNDQAMRDFHIKAWVCVSNDFDVTRITKAILEDVTRQHCDLKELQPIQAKLQEALAGKQFLIVLDDIWDKSYGQWEALRSPFKFGAPGSRIIVTTREREVALMTASIESYQLKLLSDDDCWSLFKKHAFENRDIVVYPNLESIRGKIVERCSGLPLAARTLGGLLCHKSMDEWEGILSSKIWSLPHAECEIFPVLRLSYHNLPAELKRCFAYCAIFPQDFEFGEEELVYLWIGEGFIPQLEGNQQVIELGRKYFRELVSRSIFQASTNDGSQFVMHDLVHELAQWAASETCLRLEGDLEFGKQHKGFDRARHFSYSHGWYDNIRKLEVLKEVKCLRTFLPVSVYPRWGCCLTNNVLLYLLPKLEKLRILSFSGYNITELPDSIGDLKHLRFLNLSYTWITGLPESTCSLYNLQSLILTNCRYLRRLPSKMENLINLCYLDVTNVDLLEEILIGLKDLRSLQKLSNLDLRIDCGSTIKELNNLNCLHGAFCISNLKNIVDAKFAKEANLKKKKNIDDLKLIWSHEFDDSRDPEIGKHVLDMLRPHEDLKNLTIKCYPGNVFSTWLGDPLLSNIKLLKLENCKRCTFLPPLGQLSSLKVLVIKGMSGVKSVGAEFCGRNYSNPFPLLETLSFEDMQEWENWSGFEISEQVEIFPRLHVLSIVNCPKLLGKLPVHLLSLEKLEIHKCEKLNVIISAFIKLCNLDIDRCQRIVCGRAIELTRLEHLKIGGGGDYDELIRVKLPSTIEYFILHNCGRLDKLPMILCSLTHLRELRIDGCSSLISLPSVVLSSSVHELAEIRNCENLKTLLDEAQDDINLGNSTSSAIIKQLRIVNCPSLECLSSTGELPASLSRIEIEECPKLESVARALPISLTHINIEGCARLKFITEKFMDNSRLERIRIYGCEDFQYLPKSLHKLSHLYRIALRRCPNFISFPEGELPISLTRIKIERCARLNFITERFLDNSRLEKICILDCEDFQSFPKGLHKLSHLNEIALDGCPNFISFPEGGLPTTNLTGLGLGNCEKLKALPDGMHNLTSLQSFSIEDCPLIKFVPEEGFLTNLTRLQVSGVNICSPIIEWGLHRLTSLTDLSIGSGCPDMEEIGMNLPTSLIQLNIGNFPNLKHLSSNCFRNLMSLEFLYITKCPKLKSLPNEALPLSLLRMDINECPLLEKRCKRDKGKDWSKIAHIPCVIIDRKSID